MKHLHAPLSPREATTLMQIRLRARLEPHHRVAANRLIHLGLVDETAQGLYVTPPGQERCALEARRRGLLDDRSP